MTTQETMLIKVDPKANNNKFYHVTLQEDGTVEKRWGRVGAQGTTSREGGGQVAYDRIIRQKERKGYKKTDVLTDFNSDAPSQTEVKKAAHHALIKGDTNPALETLIDTLVANNRHEILEKSGGKITLDDSGKIKTPLGYIGATSIEEARGILHTIERKKLHKDSDSLSRYLTLVPQKVPHKGGWYETFFEKTTTVSEQLDFLDQLEDSLKWAENTLEAQKTADNEDTDTSKYDALFRLQIQLLDGQPEADKIFSHVEHLFESTKSTYHPSHNYKLKQVFLVHDEGKEEEWNKLSSELGNVKELWHGTSASNVLSIMRRGLFCPPTTGGNYSFHGRMYGDGIYASNQATKALNYAIGGVWGNDRRRHDSGYMFLADIVMGNEYRPNNHGHAYADHSIPHNARNNKDRKGKPYNSISVKGGTTGVINNEMIVWHTDQIKLKYLCEFTR